MAIMRTVYKPLTALKGPGPQEWSLWQEWLRAGWQLHRQKKALMEQWQAAEAN